MVGTVDEHLTFPLLCFLLHRTSVSCAKLLLVFLVPSNILLSLLQCITVCITSVLTYPPHSLVLPVVTCCLLSLLDEEHFLPPHFRVLQVGEYEVGHPDLGIGVEEVIESLWNGLDHTATDL